MLVRFAVDPDVFLPTANLDDTQRHKSLLQLWEHVGQIVIPGEREKTSRFLNALKEAPQEVQVLWRVALRRFRKCTVDAVIDEAIQSNAIPTVRIQGTGSQDTRIKLVSLERTRGSNWGLRDNEHSKTILGDVEICRFGHEGLAQAFSQAIELTSKPITVADTPDRVWAERIREFARASRNIVISDRYAMSNFLESGQRNGKKVSGLERLLIKLEDLSAPTPRILTIYSALKEGQSFEAASKKLSTFVLPMLGRNIREVRLNMAEDRRFGAITHYRYIRFDDHQILLLDTGLEPLSGDAISRTCVATLVPWRRNNSAAYRNDEKEVQALITFERKISSEEAHA